MNKEKSMAEMNNQELFAVLAGYGGSTAQYELRYVLAKAANYIAKTGEKPKDLEQAVKWFLQGKFDLY